MSWMSMMAADGTGGGMPPIAAPKGTYNQQPVGMGGTNNGGPGYPSTFTGMGAGGYAPPGQAPLPGSPGNTGGGMLDPTTGYRTSPEAAMFGLENAGTLAMQNQVGIAPGTGPMQIDETGQPKPPPPPDAPEKQGEGFDWMKLMQSNGGGGMPPISAPRGSRTTTPQAVIDPKTGLLRWEGGNNIA